MNTRTRDCSLGEAVARARAAAEELERSGAPVIYQKIDSPLRSHWAEELKAVTAVVARPQRVLVCPAFPARVRLMLVGPRLPVIHVSAHVSLREALGLVTRERILRTIELGVEMARRLGLARPRVAVAGLNPHASDAGLFGQEEELEIAPAVAAAKRAGFRVEGPLPPDTILVRAARGEFDLVVAIYHDQGHIAAKILGFAEAVNVTAGLPIIRTSVEHGTAFDLVGQDKANPRSMELAILLAGRLARSQPAA